MELIKELDKKHIKLNPEEFNVGDTIRVYAKIVEGDKERLQGFEGLVIAKKGGGVSSTFTVRKIVKGIGVERIFPLHSPKVEKIKIIKHGKVKKAKLYYMRKRIGSAALKITEREISQSSSEVKPQQINA